MHKRLFLFYIHLLRYHQDLPSDHQKPPRNSPLLPHPATMTPTSLALALATATSAFLPIAGQPNDNNLVRINDALASILQKVTYDRAQGAQNLWGLIADAD